MSILSRTIGQSVPLKALQRDLDNQKLSHASLLLGPESMGKWRIAKQIAQSIYCPQSCGHCQSCRLIESGTHPDVTIFADDGESLKIDTIRQLIHTVHLTSQNGHRCVLIEHIERMPIEAQNAFLKTLEEPVGKLFFIMTTKDSGRLLGTLLSRVRTYHLAPIESEALGRQLKTHGLEGEILEEILQLAQGRPGLAFELFHKPEKRAVYKEFYLKIERLFSQNDLLAKFEFAEDLEKDPEELKLFFDLGFYYLRKILHQSLSFPRSISLSPSQIVSLFESLLKTSYLIQGNINKRLALEHFFLQTEWGENGV